MTETLNPADLPTLADEAANWTIEQIVLAVKILLQQKAYGAPMFSADDLRIVLDELHERAIADERGRRQRHVIRLRQVQVGDIIDFELVTSTQEFYPGYGPTSLVRLRYGYGQWTEPYAATEVVTVHRGTVGDLNSD